MAKRDNEDSKPKREVGHGFEILNRLLHLHHSEVERFGYEDVLEIKKDLLEVKKDLNSVFSDERIVEVLNDVDMLGANSARSSSGLPASTSDEKPRSEEQLRLGQYISDALKVLERTKKQFSNIDHLSQKFADKGVDLSVVLQFTFFDSSGKKNSIKFYAKDGLLVSRKILKNALFPKSAFFHILYGYERIHQASDRKGPLFISNSSIPLQVSTFDQGDTVLPEKFKKFPGGRNYEGDNLSSTVLDLDTEYFLYARLQDGFRKICSFGISKLKLAEVMK